MMKYFIVTLLMVILCLYAFTDYQMDKNETFIAELAVMKSSLSQTNRTINLLENHYTKPTHYLFSLPLHEDDYNQLTSPYGYRELTNPKTGGETKRVHEGLDLSGTWNARILSTGDGVIIEKWYVPGSWKKGHPVFGGYVKILHKNGMISGYGHLSTIYVHEGDIVQQGQLIGRMGDTGISYGEHLHYSLELADGTFVNPLQYIDIKR